MTPYTKKIVELHKIHKAIEEKDCCNGGGSDSSSEEITIDDVVKFIHDELENSAPGIFPYTTWDSIPNYDDVYDGEFCKGTNIHPSMFSMIILSIPSYSIGKKEGIG